MRDSGKSKSDSALDADNEDNYFASDDPMESVNDEVRKYFHDDKLEIKRVGVEVHNRKMIICAVLLAEWNLRPYQFSDTKGRIIWKLLQKKHYQESVVKLKIKVSELFRGTYQPKPVQEDLGEKPSALFYEKHPKRKGKKRNFGRCPDDPALVPVRLVKMNGKVVFKPLLERVELRDKMKVLRLNISGYGGVKTAEKIQLKI